MDNATLKKAFCFDESSYLEYVMRRLSLDDVEPGKYIRRGRYLNVPDSTAGSASVFLSPQIKQALLVLLAKE